jgi:sterol desaturase/sphingolipid hydroxylase (fatty acid hydroxylase superfamily)
MEGVFRLSLRYDPLETARCVSLPFGDVSFKCGDLRIGVTIGTIVLAWTALLELFSLAAVRTILKEKGGRVKYATALWYNLVNMLILLPAGYAVAAPHFTEGASPAAMVLTGVGTVVSQSFGYYMVHKAMHTPRLYPIHKFHHTFHSTVCPLSANAVSFWEYNLAYSSPFVLGSMLLKPARHAFLAVSLFLAALNGIIHTPRLAALSARVTPWWWTSTHDHLEHHRSITTNFAAPALSVDRILARASGASPAARRSEGEERPTRVLRSAAKGKAA